MEGRVLLYSEQWWWPYCAESSSQRLSTGKAITCRNQRTQYLTPLRWRRQSISAAMERPAVWSRSSQIAQFLCRATIDLDLILPYFSQPGQYRVTVASERGAASPVVSVSGVAQTVTARTELKITLNLRDLPSGKYYLGTIEQSNGESYFYPVNLD
jgi:hypothetical protein